MPTELPAWLELRRGDAPILLIAPHGGRRPPLDPLAPRPNLKVNDVETTEFTRELATRLGATAIINHGLDRNDIDLNRISQVRKHAPWFLALITAEVDRLLEVHPAVTAVFIHGWNTGQAKCDIGIGARETADGIVAVDGAHLSVGPDYASSFVAKLRRVCASASITIAVGERYPASNANNLVQLFTDRGGEHGTESEAAIASHCCARRLHALQLELGIPLRFAGARRTHFLAALADVLVEPLSEGELPPSTKAGPWPSGPLALPPSAASHARAPISLQAFDPVAGIGVIAGIGSLGTSLGARLLLLLGGQTVALFTGEEPIDARVVAPLELTAFDDGVELNFDGPMLQLGDADLYMDLEQALAASHLIDAMVSLRFARTLESDAWPGLHYGRISGVVRVGDRQIDIAADGLAGRIAIRSAGAFVQSTLAASFGDKQFLLARATSADQTLSERVGESIEPIGGARLTVHTSADHSPVSLEWRDQEGDPLIATPISRMPIVRTLGKSGYVRVTFGAAHVRWGDREGHALYEHAVPLLRT